MVEGILMTAGQSFVAFWIANYMYHQTIVVPPRIPCPSLAGKLPKHMPSFIIVTFAAAPKLSRIAMNNE